MEAPVFIVGCARSGTSLLRDLLRSHPRLAFPDESNFLPLFYRAFGDPRTDAEAYNLAARILRLQWVRRWSLSLTPSSLAHCRSYAELVSSLYDDVARRQGRPRWGDKTPHYVLEIPTLLEIFPGAKVIHIYRDGRDVALSWRAIPLGPRDVVNAAVRWKRRVVAGLGGGSRFPGSYHEVRYETLLARPEETMMAVCAFLAEDFTEDVLRPTREDAPAAPVASDTEIAAGNHSKWKSSMTPGERARFEGVAGDLLASLGYETEGIGTRAPVRRLAGRIRTSSRLFVRSLGSPETFALMNEAGVRARFNRSSASS
jgi:sulfotransferase family protein